MLPLFIGLCAFILQVDNLARIVAAHLTIAVLDHTVFVVTAKQLQASLLYPLHLSTALELNTVRTPGIKSPFSFSFELLHTVHSPPLTATKFSLGKTLMQNFMKPTFIVQHLQYNFHLKGKHLGVFCVFLNLGPIPPSFWF